MKYLVLPENFLELFGVKYGDKLYGAEVLKPALSQEQRNAFRTPLKSPKYLGKRNGYE